MIVEDIEDLSEKIEKLFRNFKAKRVLLVKLADSAIHEGVLDTYSEKIINDVSEELAVEYKIREECAKIVADEKYSEGFKPKTYTTVKQQALSRLAWFASYKTLLCRKELEYLAKTVPNFLFSLRQTVPEKIIKKYYGE